MTEKSICRRPLRCRVWLTIAVFALAGAGSVGDAAAQQTWQLLAVHDGDTAVVRIPELPPELQRVGVRVRGVDAPELGGRARCWKEKVLANQARDFTVKFLSEGPMQLEDLAWDKYGGRVLARVTVNGEDLAAALIAAGLGHPYDGQGRRQGWC